MHSNDAVTPNRSGRPGTTDTRRPGRDFVSLHAAMDSGAPIEAALAALCRLIEARLPGAVCAVMLASPDGESVSCIAGPNLPPGYAVAIDRTRIAPGAGSCSAAIQTGLPAVAADIAGDARWTDWRELALAYSFQSCIASPIFDARANAIGSFDIYMRGLREPTATDIDLADAAAQLAGLALEHRSARRALADARRRFIALASGLSAPFAVLDAAGAFHYVNPAFAARFGRAAAEWETRRLADLIGDAANASMLARIEQTPAGQPIEIAAAAAVGSTRELVQLSLAPCRNDDDRIDTLLLTVHQPAGDPSVDRARAARMAQAVEAANLAFFEIDVQTRSIELSERFAVMLGEHRGKRVVTFAAYMDRVHPQDRPLVAKRFVAILRGDTTDLGVEHRLRHAHGEHVWLHAHGRAIEQDAGGRPTRLAGTLSDINERRKAEQYIQQLAYHDPLTALPNRRMYQLSLERTVRRAQRDGRPVALLCIGLDRFRRINDVAGHAAGDRVLQEMARRLTDAVRPDDLLCRPGGDEFAVVCDSGESLAEVVDLARHLCDAMADPTTVAGRDLRITASVGISMYPDDASDATDLIRNASIALQRAKDMGRNNHVRTYSAHMDALASQRLTLECQLREALARGEMTLYYQPIVDSARGGVQAVEALMRWRHPDHGTVLPERFLPIAEDAGLDDELGGWAIMEACRQSQAWCAQGLPASRIAVNVSGRHLSGAIVEHVVHALKETGWPAELLQLEISEAALGADPRHSARILDRLKMLGVRLAVDDFGVAGSSLTALKHFPLDVLKIDRSFVHELGTSAADAAIVDSIVALSRALAFEVVAEGVETEAQLRLLREHGVDSWQGYLAVSPMPADACARWLLQRHDATRANARAVAHQPELV